MTVPARTVIEVLETVDLDDEAVQGCRELVEAGFLRLALDDFVWVAGSERVLELASIVKVDFLTTSRSDVLGPLERCRPFDVLMLAEKVEQTRTSPGRWRTASTSSRATRSSGPPW